MRPDSSGLAIFTSLYALIKRVKLLLMLPTHEKKEHQQQQMWGKGVGNEVLQQATILV